MIAIAVVAVAVTFLLAFFVALGCTVAMRVLDRALRPFGRVRRAFVPVAPIKEQSTFEAVFEWDERADVTVARRDSARCAEAAPCWTCGQPKRDGGHDH